MTKTQMEIQMKMFSSLTNATTLNHAVEEFKKLPSAQSNIFPFVFNLLQLMLTFPITSCECERSFSALRRLKTWLRATMGQVRLNSVAVCNVHKKRLDTIDICKLAEEFIGQSTTRNNKFGRV